MAKKVKEKLSKDKVVESTQPQVVKKSEADVLWDSIKNVPISLFGLSPKKLSEYCNRIDVMPDKVHLSLNGPTALIPAVEDALNLLKDGFGGEKRLNRFEVEQTQNGMLVISKVSLSK